MVENKFLDIQFYKNLNQRFISVEAHFPVPYQCSLTGFDKIVINFDRIIEMLQNYIKVLKKPGPQPGLIF